VLGGSGCGKAGLVRSGMANAVRLGLASWKHTDIRITMRISVYTNTLQLEVCLTSNTMIVLMIHPGLEPYPALIQNDLRSLQGVVGGYIETVTLSDTAVLVCNEEGKLNRLKSNRKFGDDMLVGTFFIVGYKGEEFVSLSDSDIDRFTKMFQLPASV